MPSLLYGVFESGVGPFSFPDAIRRLLCVHCFPQLVSLGYPGCTDDLELGASLGYDASLSYDLLGATFSGSLGGFGGLDFDWDVPGAEIEILGEAAARVPEAGRQRWPEIPWAKIVGLRNRLVHDYDKVHFGILWTTVVDDLP